MMAISPELSIRQRLRDATATAHAALDARMSPFLTADEDGYRTFLTASAAALIPMEQALTEAGAEKLLPDWPERVRAAALADDLEAMGGAPVAMAPADPIRGEAFLWGALYVLEGSRLGAQVLLKTAHAHPSARVRGATRYLAHGAGKGLWARYLARLEAASAPHADASGAVAGAESAFVQFDRALSAVLRRDAAPAPP